MFTLKETRETEQPNARNASILGPGMERAGGKAITDIISETGKIL